MALHMYLIPLNCTLEMVKMLNFMLCEFYSFKKLKKMGGGGKEKLPGPST